jgi:hypothetical protein
MKKKSIVILSSALFLILMLVGGWFLYKHYTSPERLATNLAKEYVNQLNSIKVDTNLFVASAKFDSVQLYIESELKKYADKYSKESEDYKVFNATFHSYSDTVYDKVCKNLSKNIYKLFKGNWWVKENEKDYKNYLFSFQHDTICIVNRKGFSIYAFEGGNNIKIDSVKYHITFNEKEEFKFDSIRFKKACFSDSLIGSFGGASYRYNYSEYFDDYYKQRTGYSVKFEPDSNVTNLYSNTKYSIKNNYLIFDDLKLEIHKRIWFDKGNLKFKGLNCNYVVRNKSEKININDILSPKKDEEIFK